MEICKTDIKHIISLLAHAAEFYDEHAVRLRDQDKPRLIRKQIKKLNKLLNQKEK